MNLPKALLLLAATTFCVFVYTHGQVSKTLLLYDIHDYQREAHLLDETHAHLTFEVSRLSSSPTLEKALAKGNLLLEFPAERQVIRLAEAPASVEERVPKQGLLDFLSAANIAEATSR